LHFVTDDGIVVVEVGKGWRVPISDRGATYRDNRKKQKAKGKMTTSEYLQTPETVLPRELAYGVLRVADSPIVPHQRVVGDLYLALAPFVRDRRLGEVLLAPMDVVLDFDGALVVQPDLLFVAEERRHIVADRVYGAPDLVIEVLSPQPRIGRLDERLGWFARYGVRECWLVNLPTRQVSVLALTPSGVASRTLVSESEPIPSAVLSGLLLTPLQIFGW
jgi:Uma2 family endonuclease